MGKGIQQELLERIKLRARVAESRCRTRAECSTSHEQARRDSPVLASRQGPAADPQVACMDWCAGTPPISQRDSVAAAHGEAGGGIAGGV